jgi:molybdopterin-containing oxidoreductase family membrane subunit
MAITAETIEHSHAGEHEDPRQHLMLDPKPRGEMNALVMESMRTTSWKFWVVFVILSLVVAVCLFVAWGYLISEGLVVSGVNPY